MPARRKSLAELALSGTLKNTPSKYAARVQEELGLGQPAAHAAPGDLGDPPKGLHAGQKKAWAEIADSNPTLTKADRLQVEQAARLLSASRNPKKEFASRDHKLLAQLLKALSAPRKAAGPATALATAAAQAATAALLPAHLRPRQNSEDEIAAIEMELMVIYLQRADREITDEEGYAESRRLKSLLRHAKAKTPDGRVELLKEYNGHYNNFEDERSLNLHRLRTGFDYCPCEVCADVREIGLVDMPVNRELPAGHYPLKPGYPCDACGEWTRWVACSYPPPNGKVFRKCRDCDAKKD